MTIWDFPISTKFGYVPGYPLNNGFHTGEDRATGQKDNIPVTVNGVVIGITGTSGASDGIHLHVDRYLNGKPTNPQGGGKTVSGAKVATVGYDSKNGHYVHIQDADGSRWGYRHLKPGSIRVQAGQELKGEDMYQGQTAEWWAKATANATSVAEARLKHLDLIAQAAGVYQPNEEKKKDEIINVIKKPTDELDVTINGVKYKKG